MLAGEKRKLHVGVCPTSGSVRPKKLRKGQKRKITEVIMPEVIKSHCWADPRGCPALRLHCKGGVRKENGNVPMQSHSVCCDKALRLLASSCAILTAPQSPVKEDVSTKSCLEQMDAKTMWTTGLSPPGSPG